MQQWLGSYGIILSFCSPHTQRGLAPRVFDYLFQKISEEEDAKVSCPKVHDLSSLPLPFLRAIGVGVLAWPE